MSQSPDLLPVPDAVEERLLSAEERLSALEREVEDLREKLRGVASVLGPGTDLGRP